MDSPNCPHPFCKDALSDSDHTFLWCILPKLHLIFLHYYFQHWSGPPVTMEELELIHYFGLDFQHTHPNNNIPSALTSISPEMFYLSTEIRALSITVNLHTRFHRWTFIHFYAKILSSTKLALSSFQKRNKPILFLDDYVTFLADHFDLLNMITYDEGGQELSRY